MARTGKCGHTMRDLVAEKASGSDVVEWWWCEDCFKVGRKGLKRVNV